MTPLPLSGQASLVTGFAESNQVRAVLRLRDPTTVAGPLTAWDVALVKDQQGAQAARSAGFDTVVLIGEGSMPSDVSREVRLGSRFSYLADGDIIGLEPKSRRLRTLYRKASQHNTFLVTERCNNYCLMCSQPPRDVDDGWVIDEIAEALPLVDPATSGLGFTGGEPLLEWRRFIPLLAQTQECLPSTEVHVLTNGRAFADNEIATAWSALKHPRLCAGIPLYSCVDVIHDHVVQAHGAFDETVLGIMRLKDKGQKVEVRLVLHRLTAPGLVETCAWLARNLPFVDHVALMGMENTGFALANQEELWIDPVDYRNDLAAGTTILASAGLHVSIYNLPRCVLDQDVWKYAVQSISDWKNGFLPQCDACTERQHCGGFFSSGKPRFSRDIKPIF